MTTDAISSRHNLLPLLWILVCDVIVAVAQKLSALAGSGEGFHFYLSMAKTPWFWVCLLLPAIQLVLWTKLLSKVDLSLAMPLTSLCYPCTMVAAHFVFDEHYSWQAWGGALLIMVGVALLGGREAHEGDATLGIKG